MTYAYENLGEDRFQQLCQAILISTYPDVQCLPVGQPDGGRDAFIRRALLRPRVDNVVFQVKFSKNPDAKDERVVIDDLIRTESRKIKALRKNGLEKYYFLTNVSGTSHYNSGSIDRINDTLSEIFEIPAYCWWRDDLDRRIDSNSSIKWSYPDIIRGSDILQALYEGKFGAQESRRLSAIKAYLSHQYKYDSQLKFKQVDLEKGLVDLFVDVPAAAVGPANPRDREKWREQFERIPSLSALVSDDHRRHQRDEKDRVRAVHTLVDPLVTAALPRVVIEGAPGQGKSTVTQFLCQLHRILLLKKNWEIQRVPVELRPTDVRLPLRVDLRDYATWLSGRTPFQDADTQSTLERFSPALESFLAAQISAQSGGLQFSPDDLLAFAANSALLIVLDGFDEVADISTRNRLVREISDASTRFEGNAISNQVIVTSRPASFANSPGFPHDEWQYIQILPLTRYEINIYTDKWMSGHNLDKKERKEITSVLHEKLEYPHVRELARNPMQLAILLALISTQGASLPDKRTTLYDRYIDIFFNRESEKSKVVRDKRDLLIDMHRYLAWTLQVEAESNAKAGNISEQRLREVLRAYLTEMGHDAALVDDLFTGIVERVVALVSRVQGTFEFEVQPLREYFAARYLYDTAPYVQAGSSRSGSIMDRFDALARNAYWLNVTRFYCGCYSSGELPSLVDGLISIGLSEQYGGTVYISELALTLLGDYVFSQQPRSVARLTDFLFEQSRFRLMLANAYEERGDGQVSLPEGSGRAKLLDSAVTTFKTAKHFDTAFTAATVIKSNLGDRSATEVWQEAKSNFAPDQALHFAGFLDVLETMAESELLDLINKGGPKALRMCVYRNRPDVLNLRPNFWRQFVELSLDGRAAWLGFRLPSSETGNSEVTSMRLMLTLVGAISALNLGEEQHREGTLLELARHFGYPHESSVADVCRIEDKNGLPPFLDKEIIAVACALVSAEVARTFSFERDLSSFLGLMLRDFGHRSLIVDAAIAALEWFRRGSEIVEHSGVLATLAEMQDCSRQSDWWRERFASVLNGETRFLLCKAYLAWSTDKVLGETIEAFSKLVDKLSPTEFHSLYGARTGRHSPFPPAAKEALKPGFKAEALRNVGMRAAALVYQMVDSANGDLIFKTTLEAYDGSNEDIIDARLNGAWHYAIRNPEFWSSAFEIVADGYAQGVAFDRLYGVAGQVELPILEAKNITQSPELYPLSVLSIAERALAQRTGTQVIPVGSVAARDQWFAEI